MGNDINYDSSYTVYIHQKNTVKRAKSLVTIVDYWMNKHPDSAFKYAKLLYNISNTSNDNLYILKSNIKLGLAFHNYSNSDSCLFYLLKAEELSVKFNNCPIEDKFQLYKFLASSYTVKGKYIKSTDYSIKALKIAKSVDNKKWIRNANVVFAENQAAIGNLRGAANYYLQALNLKTYDSKEEDIKEYIYLSDIYLQLFRPDSSLYFSSLARKQSTINSSYFYYSGLSQAASYMDLKKYNNAIDVLTKDKLGAASMNDNQYKGYAMFILGNCYLLLHQLDSAKNYLNPAIEFAKISGAIDLEIQLYKSLEKYSTETNNYKAAYEYAKNSFALSDSIHTLNNEKQIANLSSNFELEKKQAEIKIQEDELRKNRNLLIASAIAIIAFIILATLLIINNRKRKALNNKLAELNTKKDRLFNVMSHDLRSPLADLFNTLQIETDKLPGNYNKTNLKNSQQRLSVTLNMLDNLLYWSVGQIKGLQYNPTAFYISNAIEDSIAINNHLIDSKSIILTNNADENIMAYADQQMITTVLRNLIQNAIKFSEENGEIIIETKELKNNILSCSIKDFGKGIPPSDLPHIFDGGISKTGTKGEKGTGVGLNLCKTFIELNKGTIYIESTLEKGITIYIEIPLAS